MYTYDSDDDGATLVNEPSEFSVSHVCCIRKKDECHFGEIIQRTLIRGYRTAPHSLQYPASAVSLGFPLSPRESCLPAVTQI